MYIVRRSKIGLGLFATTDIPKGAKIIQYVGERIGNDEIEKHKGKYLFTLDDKYTIDGKSRKNLARYINHSCRPNTYTEIVDGEIWVFAKRKIKTFEELTFHYGKEYFNQFIKPKGCRCAKCAPAFWSEETN
jgi:hypothetical protein